MTPNYRISQALAADSWDWVCIQQGSRDGSFYSREESYTELPKLVEYIRRRVPAHTRIGFNMTWVGEPENNRPEMIFYGRQQQRLFGAISALTRDLLAPMEGIDRICPIGTAIQNARTAVSEPLTRDGYHLSLTLGRYIAALTFWKALTGGDLRMALFKYIPGGKQKGRCNQQQPHKHQKAALTVLSFSHGHSPLRRRIRPTINNMIPAANNIGTGHHSSPVWGSVSSGGGVSPPSR